MNRLRASAGGGGSGFSPLGAALDLWFARDLYANYGMRQTLAEATTFSRASVADWRDAAGTGFSTQAGNNVLRRDGRGALIEESRTNTVPNSTCAGAVAGTPGTLPTGWGTSLAAGISQQIVGSGTSNGIPYVDIRLSGAATGVSQVIFTDFTSIVASSGQSWAGYVFINAVSGSLNNISLSQVVIREGTSAGAFVRDEVANFSLALSSVLQRAVVQIASANASTQRVGFRIFVESVGAIDITLRIGLPQLEQASSALSPILTSGSSATRAADVLSSSFSLSGDLTFVIIGRATNTNLARLLALTDGTNNNAREIFLNSNNLTMQQTVGGVGTGGGSVTIPSVGTRFAYAARFADTVAGAAASLNGATPVTLSYASVPTGLTTLNIGNRATNDRAWNQFIERVLVFPTAVNNATLQSYSTLATWGG